MRHEHPRDVAGFRRLQPGAGELRGHGTEHIAALEALRRLQEYPARVFLRGHLAAERRAEAGHGLAPSARPARTADAVEYRFGEQLEELLAVADVPVERRGLDVEPV